MARHESIRCDCGGRLSRPIPPVCPHCGRTIAQVRHRSGPRIFHLLLILGMFGVLVAFLAWWLSRV